MERLVSAYIVLLLLFLPLLADGSAGALANLRVQAAVLLFSCLGAAIALWRKEGKAAITAVDACFAAWVAYGMARGLAGGEGDIARWTGFLSVASLYLLCRTAGGRAGVAAGVVLSGVVQAGWGILQWAGVLESRHPLFPATGTFFNPGPWGGFLAVAWVVAVWEALRRYRAGESKPARWFAAAALPLAFALVLSDSRAAWLAVAVVPLASGWRRFARWKMRCRLLAVGIALAVGCVLVAYKWESALGRLLVWRVTAGMVADDPLCGQGWGGFQAEYMHYQADYFLARGDGSAFAAVAGNVFYAFNEYLKILAEGGILGLAFFLALLWQMWRARRAAPLGGGMLALLVFAFFSYPFEFYAFQALFALLCACAAGGKPIVWLGRKTSRVVAASVLAFALAWSVAAGWVAACRPDAVWQHSPDYLRHRAMNATRQENPAQVLRDLEALAAVAPTNELYTNLGITHERLGDTAAAIACYRTAAAMMPRKIHPRWRLFRLAEARGDTRCATALARGILALPPQAGGTAALRVTAYLERYLRENP